MSRFARSSVFVWLDGVRERPGMNLPDGALPPLESMIHGYHVALEANGVVEAVPEMSQGHFGAWLQETKRWSLSCGWADAITQRLHFLRHRHGARTFNGRVLMEGNGSHSTSMAFAKRWCADELQTRPDDWRSP